jgi:hypothetical protein
VSLHTKYTGWRQNDFNVYARPALYGAFSAGRGLTSMVAGLATDAVSAVLSGTRLGTWCLCFARATRLSKDCHASFGLQVLRLTGSVRAFNLATHACLVLQQLVFIVARGPYQLFAALLGLGRIIALYYHSSTLYQIR